MTELGDGHHGKVLRGAHLGELLVLLLAPEFRQGALERQACSNQRERRESNPDVEITSGVCQCAGSGSGSS